MHNDIRKSLDVGYIQGTTVIRIRSKEDLAEMWSEIKKPRCTSSLWCDGLIEGTKKKSGRKRLISDDEDESDDDVPSRKRRKKHKSNFMFLQMRIWAELITSGLYSSTDDPPHNNSMFERVGSGGSSTSSQKDTAVTKMIAEAATAITSALSSSVNTGQLLVTAFPVLLS